MIVKGTCDISLTRAELVEMLAKLYLLDGGYSSLDPIPSSEIAKLVVKKCSLGAPAGDFALSLTARQSLRLFSLARKRHRVCIFPRNSFAVPMPQPMRSRTVATRAISS